MTATKTEVETPVYRQRRSVSQITSYSTCSEAYRLQKVEKAPSRPAGWFHQGTAAGAAIERWENDRRKTNPTDLRDLYYSTYDDLVLEDLERVGEENWQVWMTGGAKKGEDDVNDRRELGWWQVQDYQDWALSEKHLWAVVESEFKLEGTIGGVNILGYADQVVIDLTEDNTPTIWDVKSGAGVPEEPIQLVVYDYLLQQQVGTKTTGEVGFVHLGRPEKGRAKYRRTDVVKHDTANWPIERIEAWVQDMDRSEKAGIYLPSTAKDCARTCGVSQWCRSKGDWQSAQQYLPAGAPASDLPKKESA